MSKIYKESIDPKFTSDHPFNCYCIYCGTRLTFNEIDKITKYSLKDFKKDLRSNAIIVKQLEPNNEYLCLSNLSLSNERYYKRSEKKFTYEGTFIGQCKVCGWWKVTEEFGTANDNNVWQIFFEKVGSIKNFDIKDLSVPIQEIRDHLVRKYNDRLHINPRLFEEVVASIFNNLGYESVCTAYSNDGGIDIILSAIDCPIAVQVKRTKNNIKVEQIRSFLGALVINKLKRGVFVTTVDYQSGCKKIANSYGIDLIDGERFYNILKEAQIIQYANSFDIDYSQIGELYCTAAFPMNSI